MTEAGNGMTVEARLNLSFFCTIADKNKNLRNPNLLFVQIKILEILFIYEFFYEKKLSATLISATYPTLPVM